jgi:hypothetical protein
MASISDYYPARWSWKPHTRPVNVDIAFQPAGLWDIAQLAYRLSVKRRSIEHWIRETGWNVNLAVRNQFNIVAAIVSRHFHGSNEVLRHWFDDLYVRRWALRETLIDFVRYELPELPTTITVEDSDNEGQRAYSTKGATAQRVTDDHSRWIFRFPPIVTLEREQPDSLRSETSIESNAPAVSGSRVG